MFYELQLFFYLMYNPMHTVDALFIWNGEDPGSTRFGMDIIPNKKFI